MRNKPVGRVIKLLRHTGTIKIFYVYLAALIIGGLVISFVEPGVHGFFEGLYFCFVASSTIGFGDIVPVTVSGRIITIIVTIAGTVNIAMVPGVVVAYYTEFLKARENETISTFLEKLENLPSLSKQELEELSEHVREFNKRKKRNNK